jgi:probable F420-dependent oxidoreductase
MDIGIVVLPTDLSAPVAQLAHEVESRGLASLYVGGDHTHIPAARATPFPGGSDLPDEYTRTYDPIVALTVAAHVTDRIRIGTCIYLSAQRDTINLAKQAASLDRLSGGRLDLGVGYGWNVEEATDHGISWGSRRALVREQVLACRALWSEDEASFAGDHVGFERAIMRPKPATPHGPRVILGASPGPKTFASIVEWADGWFPVPFWGHGPDDIRRLREAAEQGSRDPAELAVIVDGVMPEPAMLDPWQEAGAEGALIPVPSESLDAVLPALDAAAAIAARYR